jgi:hypothetical protein
MIAELRQRFNASFTSEKYRAFLGAVESRAGTPVEFRTSETPCFLPSPLLNKMCQFGRELIAQLSTPEYLARSERSIPPQYKVPNEAPHPLFIQVDFGLVRDSTGELQPKLVELQGFPSLYAYQPVVSQAYVEVFGIDRKLRFFLSDLDWQSYFRLLRQAIVAGHDPENVVLMEIDPLHQKTLPDFFLTEKLVGIKTVDIAKIRKNGKRLFYERDGRSIPIHRIYNRAIVDELIRKNIKLEFRLTEDLDVEWAGHPNWFFRMSKFSIPFLDHESVPKSRFVNDSADTSSLDGLVLKPLYSFAGSGIILHPSPSDLAAIPEKHRGDYILQPRMNFEPVIETPLGATKAEVRIMYIWDQKLVPVLTIIRMGRGQMMGVDFNKNMDWVGSSAGLFPPE